VKFTLFTFTFTDRYRHIDDSNGNTKETENLNKYKDLEMAVSKMWKVDKNCASYNWSIRDN